MRVFLALGVVLFHYQLHWTLPPEAAGLLNRARLGVDVFFIQSGFIMAHVYLRDGRPLNYPKFLAARFARIYPAHLFILVAMLVLVLVAPLLGVGLEPGRFNAGDFVQTLILVQAWFQGKPWPSGTGRPGPCPRNGSPIWLSRSTLGSVCAGAQGPGRFSRWRQPCSS